MSRKLPPGVTEEQFKHDAAEMRAEVERTLAPARSARWRRFERRFYAVAMAIIMGCLAYEFIAAPNRSPIGALAGVALVLGIRVAVDYRRAERAWEEMPGQ